MPSFAPRHRLLCLTLFFIGMTAVGQSAEKPPLDSIAGRDLAARTALLQAIDRHQTKEFRDAEILIVPKVSKLPDAYQLKVYGSTVWLHIQVADGKATGTLIDNEGIAAGNLPHGKVDLLARQLALAFATRREPRDPDQISPSGGSFATHIPSFIIELRSTIKDAPFELITEGWQPLYNEIGFTTEDVRGFMHTQFYREITELAEETLMPLAADEQRRQTEELLRKITADKRRGSVGDTLREVSDSFREDEPAVQLQLLGRLAIAGEYADALPELRRLGSKTAVAKLEILTSQDRWPRLAQASLDRTMASWAVDVARRSSAPEATESFVQLVVQNRGKESDRALDVLFKKKLTAEQLASIVAKFDLAKEHEKKRNLARFLLFQTGEDRYFDYLVQYADDRKSGALAVLVRYASQSGRRRHDVRQIVLRQIKQTPIGDRPDSFEYFNLVRSLGDVGTPDDIALLTRLARHDSVYLASSAIDALETLAPAEAVKAARTRLAAVSGKIDDHKYSWDVAGQFDLLFWQNDREAIEPLKRAWRNLAPDHVHAQDRFDPEPLLRYLEVTEPSAKLAAALAYVRGGRVPLAWRQDVMKQLIAAGADANACQALLVRRRGDWE